MSFKSPGRLLVIFFLLVVTTLMFTLSNAATNAKTSIKSGPKAFFPETEFNAGEFPEGENLVHTFTVMNKGDKELKIIKVRPG